MLFIIEERRGGLIYDFGFGGSAWGYTGEGDKYIHYAKKRRHFMEVFQHFCPSLSERKIVLLHTGWALCDSVTLWQWYQLKLKALVT